MICLYCIYMMKKKKLFFYMGNEWQGTWKKALSDMWLTTRFSLQIALYFLVKKKENSTLYRVSLRALFRAPFK